MKKLYLAGIVLLVSLLAVSAGEYPDDDMDGICETPFCDKLDNCPKVACEIQGISVENCADPDLNKDSDGDGAGDGCDKCPSDPRLIFQECVPRKGGSGGGGAAGPGCRSTTNYNGNTHTLMGWSCVTDWDCQNTAEKLGKNPAYYVCTVTGTKLAVGSIESKECECADVNVLHAIPDLPRPQIAEQPQPVVAQQPTPTQTEFTRKPVVPPQYEPIPQQVAQPVDTDWVPLAVLLVVVLGAVAYFIYQRRR